MIKSAEFFDTANYMETSEIEPSNMRSSCNNIAGSNNCKMVKLVKKYVMKLNGNSRRCLDNIYDVYKRANLLMIGNSPIKFEVTLSRLTIGTIVCLNGYCNYYSKNLPMKVLLILMI